MSNIFFLIKNNGNTKTNISNKILLPTSLCGSAYLEHANIIILIKQVRNIKK